MVCKKVKNQHLCWWLGCVYRRSICLVQVPYYPTEILLSKKGNYRFEKKKEKSNETMLYESSLADVRAVCLANSVVLHFFPHKLTPTKTVDRWRKKDTTCYQGQSAQKKSLHNDDHYNVFWFLMFVALCTLAYHHKNVENTLKKGSKLMEASQWLKVCTSWLNFTTYYFSLSANTVTDDDALS